MRCALLLLLPALGLIGCVLDTSLGDHNPMKPPAAAEHEEQRPEPGPTADAAAPRDMIADSEPPPIAEPMAHDAPSDAPAAGAEATPPASEPAPADMPQMTDMPSAGDHPPAEPPIEEPPPMEEPPAPPPACDVATDNPCLLCDQDACCEPRHACLENAACACHIECRTAESPDACHASCGAAGDRYEPWLLCLQEHCADHCTL